MPEPEDAGVASIRARLRAAMRTHEQHPDWPCEDWGCADVDDLLRRLDAEHAGVVDVGRVDDLADLRKIRAFLAKAGELRRNVTAHDVSRVLDALAASNARAERLEAEYKQWASTCLGQHMDRVLWVKAVDQAGQRREALQKIDGLVDVLLENILGGYPGLAEHQAHMVREYARAALAGDAPGRGEAG